MLDLNSEDTRDIDYPANLTENLSYQDLVDSQDQCISVQYNEIDLGDHLFDKDLPQFRIDMPISELIRLSQSIARDGIANTAVIELMGNSQRIQACLYIAQTFLISILSQAHNQQLVMTGEVSHPVIASVLGNNIIEFPTRYELHNLCEYDLSEIHVTRFFDKDCKVSQFKSCTRNIESKSFYFNNLYLNRLVLTGH